MKSKAENCFILHILGMSMFICVCTCLYLFCICLFVICRTVLLCWFWLIFDIFLMSFILLSSLCFEVLVLVLLSSIFAVGQCFFSCRIDGGLLADSIVVFMVNITFFIIIICVCLFVCSLHQEVWSCLFHNIVPVIIIFSPKHSYFVVLQGFAWKCFYRPFLPPFFLSLCVCVDNFPLNFRGLSFPSSPSLSTTRLVSSASFPTIMKFLRTLSI